MVACSYLHERRPNRRFSHLDPHNTMTSKSLLSYRVLVTVFL